MSAAATMRIATKVPGTVGGCVGRARIRIHEIESRGTLLTPTVVVGNIVDGVKFIASDPTPARTVDPDPSTGRTHFVGAQPAVSVAIQGLILLGQSPAANSLEKVHFAVAVKVEVAPSRLHHIVGVLHGFFVIVTLGVGEYQDPVLTSLVSGTLVEVDAKPVGTLPAEPATSAAPMVATTTGMNVFARLVVLSRWSKSEVSAYAVLSWKKIDSHLIEVLPFVV